MRYRHITVYIIDKNLLNYTDQWSEVQNSSQFFLILLPLLVYIKCRAYSPICAKTINIHKKLWKIEFVIEFVTSSDIEVSF